MKDLREIFNDIRQELDSAEIKFDPFHSAHEGYALIKEELDELWDCIKDNKNSTIEEMHKEALQVATMAVRFILDVNRTTTPKT